MDTDERQLFNNEALSNKDDRNSKKVKMIDLLPQLAASCLMYSLVIQAGINMSFASVLISQLGDENEIKMDTKTASIIGSIWSISLPFGAISSGFLMDRFGRRKIGLFLCVPFFLAWILVSMSQSLTQIYLARILAGICCGLTAVSVVYSAEISYKTFRSSLLCMNSVWVSFGIFSTYLLNYFHLNWRLIGWIYAGVSLLSMALILIVPESPHWILYFNDKLSDEQKFSQLKSCVAWIYRSPKIASVQYDELIQNYERHNEEQRTNQNEQQHWINGIKLPQVYKPLIILVILFLLQQLSGGYILIFYTINIFRNLGSEFLTSVDENLASLLLGTIRLIMAIIAAVLSQRCNRKTLLYASTIGMTLFAYLAAIKMWNSEHVGHSFFSKASNNSQVVPVETEASNFGNYFLLTCILAYILFASLGILIIPWTCIAELYSIKYKASFGGLTVAIAYILMSMVLKVFPFMIDSLDIYVIFFIFGTSSLLCCIFVYYFLPETHRKTFSEIENYFIGRNQ
ncbi:glucose transporter GlcP-like [Chironomus tepperi]|uniref:glucose transporter GlcP-like n=1 Tax=Chironomus tepperi TaxID=113505 RepID=UPI00391F8F6E